MVGSDALPRPSRRAVHPRFDRSRFGLDFADRSFQRGMLADRLACTASQAASTQLLGDDRSGAGI
ncbi:MAG: hypothetical protein WB772_03035 [Xanthobacteraceae bacterium]